MVLDESGGLPDSSAGWRRYRDYLWLLAEEDPQARRERFASLSRGWQIGSTASRAEIRAGLAQGNDLIGRFTLLGADRESILTARAEVWEEQLRALAQAFQTPLNALPRQKSAVEKLRLAAAMKSTTSASNRWLAQRLQMGATDSVSSLLFRFRACGGTTEPGFKAILSGFRT